MLRTQHRGDTWLFISHPPHLHTLCPLSLLAPCDSKPTGFMLSSFGLLVLPRACPRHPQEGALVPSMATNALEGMLPSGLTALLSDSEGSNSKTTPHSVQNNLPHITFSILLCDP